MAKTKTCVHKRQKERGPIITPKGSWCFMCDDGGSHGKSANGNGWGPARQITQEQIDERLQIELFPPPAMPSMKVNVLVDVKIEKKEERQPVGHFLGYPVYETRFKTLDDYEEAARIRRRAADILASIVPHRAAGITFNKPTWVAIDPFKSERDRNEWDTVKLGNQWVSAIPAFDFEKALRDVNYHSIRDTERTEPNIMDTQFFQSSATGRIAAFDTVNVVINNPTYKHEEFAVLLGNELKDYNVFKRIKKLNEEIRTLRATKRAARTAIVDQSAREERAESATRNAIDARYKLICELGVGL
jgi:hypothetical protein